MRIVELFLFFVLVGCGDNVGVVTAARENCMSNAQHVYVCSFDRVEVHNEVR